MWTHSQGVFPLRAELAKAFQIDPKQVRCIHAEGAGCYGHNGADDVALDAALVARASEGRPVKLQWMRDDEFQWEPYGSAMVMKLAGGIDGQGNIVGWSHEVWSHPHSTRPGSSAGVNLLAARDLAQPFPLVPPADVPQPTGGSDRNAIPLYDFPNVKVVKHFIDGGAAAHVRAAHAGRLRQRVRAGIVRRRAGGRRGRGPGGAPTPSSQRSARPRRGRGGGSKRRVAAAGARRRHPWSGLRVFPVQEPRLLLRDRGRRRGRSARPAV